jgi:hypothetical protein
MSSGRRQPGRERAVRVTSQWGVIQDHPRTEHISELEQAVNMDLSNATAWFATTAVRLRRLWCPFGEVQ